VGSSDTEVFKLRISLEIDLLLLVLDVPITLTWLVEQAMDTMEWCAYTEFQNWNANADPNI